MNDDIWRRYPVNLVALSQLFDLSSSAMKGTLSMLAQSSELVKEVNVHGTQIDWVLNVNGHTVRSAGGEGLSNNIQESILMELVGVHARHHACVEPTFLILDDAFVFHHSSAQIASLERLQDLAGHAQVAVIITHSPALITAMGNEWAITDLEYSQSSEFYGHDSPLDFEIETSTRPPENLASP